MRKTSSKIREEIAHLQEQLKAAETGEAERIGRLALKAGLRYEKRALLLGLLIDDASRIKADGNERARLLAFGEMAFTHEP